MGVEKSVSTIFARMSSILWRYSRSFAVVIRNNLRKDSLKNFYFRHISTALSHYLRNLTIDRVK